MSDGVSEATGDVFLSNYFRECGRAPLAGENMIPLVSHGYRRCERANVARLRLSPFEWSRVYGARDRRTNSHAKSDTCLVYRPPGAVKAGLPAAPECYHLPLLPFGPDGVRRASAAQGPTIATPDLSSRVGLSTLLDHDYIKIRYSSRTWCPVRHVAPSENSLHSALVALNSLLK